MPEPIENLNPEKSESHPKEIASETVPAEDQGKPIIPENQPDAQEKERAQQEVEAAFSAPENLTNPEVKAETKVPIKKPTSATSKGGLSGGGVNGNGLKGLTPPISETPVLEVEKKKMSETQEKEREALVNFLSEHVRLGEGFINTKLKRDIEEAISDANRAQFKSARTIAEHIIKQDLLAISNSKKPVNNIGEKGLNIANYINDVIGVAEARGQSKLPKHLLDAFEKYLEVAEKKAEEEPASHIAEIREKIHSMQGSSKEKVTKDNSQIKSNPESPAPENPAPVLDKPSEKPAESSEKKEPDLGLIYEQYVYAKKKVPASAQGEGANLIGDHSYQEGYLMLIDLRQKIDRGEALSQTEADFVKVLETGIVEKKISPDGLEADIVKGKNKTTTGATAEKSSEVLKSTTETAPVTELPTESIADNSRDKSTKEKSSVEKEALEEQDPIVLMRQEALKEQEENLLKKYEHLSEVSEGAKTILREIINKEIEDDYQKFAVAWIKDHREELKGAGIVVAGLSDTAAAKLLLGNPEWSKKALADLESQEKYQGYKDSRGRGLDLLKDLQKDQLPLETRYLLINRLNRQVEKFEDQKKSATKEGAVEIEKNIEKTRDLQKELLENIIGRSLDEYADEQLRANPARGIEKGEFVQNYLNSRLESEIQRRLNNPSLLEGKYAEAIQKSNLSAKQKEELTKTGYTSFKGGVKLDRGEVVAALSMGWDLTKIHGKWFSEKIMLGDTIIAENAENDLTQKLKVGWEKYVKDSTKAEITEIAEKSYEQAKLSYQEGKKKVIKELIDTYSRSVKNAEGGVAGVYERIKNRLAAEFLEKLVRKEKSPDVVKKIEKKFSDKKGAEVPGLGDFIKKSVAIIDAGEVGSNSVKNKKTLKKLFSDFGISSAGKAFNEFASSDRLKAAAKGKAKKGFIDLMLTYILGVKGI